MLEPRTRPGWPTALLCLALFGVALLVRLYRLEAQSLWLDEGSSWALSQAAWPDLFAELFNPRAAYPLYHLLLKGWMALFGESEAALRLPSVVAGALAVPVVYLAAGEVERLAEVPVSSWYSLGAALLVLVAPYTIWYSQEAKVYSLLLLTSALGVWALARALRTGTRAAWAATMLLAVGALFVHRLAALLVVAGAWVVAVKLHPRPVRWGTREPSGARRIPCTPPDRSFQALGLAALLAIALVAAMVGGLGGDQAAGLAAAGAGIPAGPLLALGLTFVRFSLDRWPGDVPWWWLAPWLLLFAWGLARALWALHHPTTRLRALVLLTLLMGPLALFLAQLTFTKLYEARYLTGIYPVWALLLAYPLVVDRRPQTPDPRPQTPDPRPPTPDRRPPTPDPRLPTALFVLNLTAALVTGGLALFQPTFGLFSGDPVKEQYREAVAELASRLHPDDAVVVHPAYLRPLYTYYMRQLTADPAPTPLSFGDFWQGTTTYGQREWDIERRSKLAGATRSWLLIAPDHARTVDRPLPGDEYGLVGNFWAFSREQRTWPCGIWRFNGAQLFCQEAPEPYYTNAPAPTPAISSATTFGGNLRLLGFTLKATTAGPGLYRAGGNLPLSLFWAVETPPTKDYSFFLHLCQQCDAPPAAGEDGPPLEGYLPTSTWLPGKPARDDRAIALPHDLPPGRYTLLLGVYDPTVPTLAGRLQVTDGTDRLVLGTVTIVAAHP